MTVPPPDPGAERARRSHRLVYVAALIAVLLAALLGVGLIKSMNAGRALCPPSNPDCGLLPPSPPAADVPQSR